MTGAARLLFVAPVTGFPVILGVAPRVVVIDAACRGRMRMAHPGQELGALARQYGHHGHRSASERGALARRRRHTPAWWPPKSRPQALPNRPPRGNHENQWIADWPWLNRAGSPPGEPARRHLLAAAGARSRPRSRGERTCSRSKTRPCPAWQRSGNGLAGSGIRMACAAPWPVCRAARLTRLLTELPTRTADYDRVAPRYGGRTLRRLLDDILDADARNDFPASWRARVAADWGAARAVLTASYEALTVRNPLTNVIADLVEDAYRCGQQLDIVCGSRTAQEALTGRLASSGTLRIEASPLVTLRSISTVDPAGAHQMTLLVGPPAARWRHRLAAADLGQLTILGTSACFRPAPPRASQRLW